MKTITFTVRHGSTNQTVSASGSTIEEALAGIKATRLGIGYAVEPENPHHSTIVKSLETTGKASLGWGDYALS